MSQYHYCLLCKRNFNNKEWKHHKFTKNHKAKLMKFLHYQYLKIDACIHVEESKKRKRNTNPENDSEVMNQFDAGLASFECRFCDFKCEANDSITSTWDHLVSPSHKTTLDTLWREWGVNILLKECMEKMGIPISSVEDLDPEKLHELQIPKHLIKANHKIPLVLYEKLVLLYRKSQSNLEEQKKRIEEKISLEAESRKTRTSDQSEFKPKNASELRAWIASIPLPQDFNLNSKYLNPKRVGASWSDKLTLFLRFHPEYEDCISKLSQFGEFEGFSSNEDDNWRPKYGGAWSSSRLHHKREYTRGEMSEK